MMLIEAAGSFVGMHFWREGVERGFPELAEPHEHTFNVRVWMVADEFREVEFIRFGRDCATRLENFLAKVPSASCEKMAAYLVSGLKRSDLKVLAVRVQEDDGGAGIVLDEDRLGDALGLQKWT